MPSNMRLSRSHIRTFEPDVLATRLREIDRRMYEELREHLVVNDPAHKPVRGKTFVPFRSPLRKP